MPRWTQDFVLKDDDDFAGVNPDGADCIRLRYKGGHKYEVIASMLQIPIGTIRSRINRGKAQILANRAAKGPGVTEPPNNVVPCRTETASV